MPMPAMAATRHQRETSLPAVFSAFGIQPLLPWFAVAFALLVAVNSTGWIPKALNTAGSDVSRWCLVAAIAGIGMKTHLKELATVGLKPVALMVAETTFLALLTLVLLRLLPGAA